MRQNMAADKIPDLTDAEAATIQAYLVKNFPNVVPYNSNNRLPRTAIEGKARDYRVVTFRLDPELPGRPNAVDRISPVENSSASIRIRSTSPR
jgi:hypothetical protein